MFNTLIVSTNERRSKRTSRFLFGTSIVYVIVIAGGLAVSVLFADAKLADTTDRVGIMITPAPPPLLGTPKPVSRAQTVEATAQQNSTNVRRLEDILSNPGPARATVRQGGPPRPPGIGEEIGEGVGDPNGVRDGLPIAVSVPGAHGNSTEPPKPADPPRPQTQLRSAESDKPVRLASVVLQGKAVARRTPDYPVLAKQTRLQGSVSVEVIIAPDGRVESARAVSGHPMLAKAAIDSAYGWRFEPTLLNGTPVRVTGIIVFNFKLSD